MSKTPPTMTQKIAIYQDALAKGESEAVARALAQKNTPVEHKQLERYIELIEKGMNRTLAAETVNLRPAHVAKLMARHPDYAEEVEAARRRYFESLIDELPRMGDGAETPVELGLAKLKSDNYKWLASKAMPKQYGDRMAVEIDHKINLSSVLLEAESRIIPVVGRAVDAVEQQLIATDGDATSTPALTDADTGLEEDMFS